MTINEENRVNHRTKRSEVDVTDKKEMQINTLHSYTNKSPIHNKNSLQIITHCLRIIEKE